MAEKTLPYNPDKPIQIIKQDGATVVVAKVDDVPPGKDYYVEVIVRPTGPGGASCTGHASCSSFAN